MDEPSAAMQEESANSGAFYVTWPHEIIDHPVIHRELTRQSDQHQPPGATRTGDRGRSSRTCLPSAAEAASSCIGIDGHVLKTPLETQVCDWLYLAQLAHAYQRALCPPKKLVHADFYVPEGSVYIDCWDEDIPAQELSGKLHRRELYKDLQACATSKSTPGMSTSSTRCWAAA